MCLRFCLAVKYMDKICTRDYPFRDDGKQGKGVQRMSYETQVLEKRYTVVVGRTQEKETKGFLFFLVGALGIFYSLFCNATLSSTTEKKKDAGWRKREVSSQVSLSFK